MVAAAIVGGAVVTAGASYASSSKASKAAGQASDASVYEQRRQFDLVRRDTAPVRELGAGAIGQLSKLQSGDMSGFYASPDYNFNLNEGQKAIDRSLAARGQALSGTGVKEGVRYASGMASNQYSSYVDRLLQQAGLGNTGIGASASAGMNAANNIGAAYMNAGNAKASAYLQQGQSVNNAVNGGIQNYMLYKYLGS